jgi:cytoskeletal protein RodZ
MASITRIAIDQIAKMEQGNFSNLPPVYARGFLKTLAASMNIDPEIFLGEYRRLSGNKEEFPSRPLQNKYVEADIIDAGGSGLGLSTYIIIALLALGVALFFFNSSFNRLVTSYLPFLEAHSPSVTTSTPGSPTSAVASAGSPSAGSPSAESTTAESTGSESTGADSTNKNGGRLTLRAAKTTWSQITVDEGATRFVYFQPGQSQTYDSLKAITVVAGDGQALRAEWNGQDLGFLGPQGPVELVFPRRP